jgi:hypothetical protein
MTRNSVGRTVSIEVFAKRNASHPYFRMGYESIMNKLPYDYDIADRGAAVRYARGRMFAIWCLQNKAPRAVWRGAVPAKTLIERIAYAARTGNTFV